MSIEQRRPDTTRIETILSRIFPPTTIKQSIYFEQVIIVDSTTLKSLGYRLFYLLRDQLYFFDINTIIHSKTHPHSIAYKDILGIEIYDDTASFFQPEDAINTIHIQISYTYRNSIELLDFYTYYTDSQLLYHLRTSWYNYYLRQSLSNLYSSTASTLSKLSYFACSQVFSYLKNEYLSLSKGITPIQPLKSSKKAKGSAIDPTAPMTIKSQNNTIISTLNLNLSPAEIHSRMSLLISKIKVLEELILCMCSSQSSIFQYLFFQSDDLYEYLLDEISLFAPYLKWYIRSYIYEYDPKNTTSVISSNYTRNIPTYSEYIEENNQLEDALAVVYSKSIRNVVTTTALDAKAEAESESEADTDDKKDKENTSTRGRFNLANEQAQYDPHTTSKYNKSDIHKPFHPFESTISSPTNPTSNTYSQSTTHISEIKKKVNSLPLYEFKSVWEVYSCRDGHPSEEVARVEYITTILMLFHHLFIGSNSLHHLRFQYMSSHSFLRMRDVLSALLLIDTSSMAITSTSRTGSDDSVLLRGKSLDFLQVKRARTIRVNRITYLRDYYSQKQLVMNQSTQKVESNQFGQTGQTGQTGQIDRKDRNNDIPVQKMQYSDYCQEIHIYSILHEKLSEYAIQQGCVIRYIYDIFENYSIYYGNKTISRMIHYNHPIYINHGNRDRKYNTTATATATGSNSLSTSSPNSLNILDTNATNINTTGGGFNAKNVDSNININTVIDPSIDIDSLDSIHGETSDTNAAMYSTLYSSTGIVLPFEEQAKVLLSPKTISQLLSSYPEYYTKNILLQCYVVFQLLQGKKIGPNRDQTEAEYIKYQEFQQLQENTSGMYYGYHIRELDDNENTSSTATSQETKIEKYNSSSNDLTNPQAKAYYIFTIASGIVMLLSTSRDIKNTLVQLLKKSTHPFFGTSLKERHIYLDTLASSVHFFSQQSALIIRKLFTLLELL